MIRIGFIPGALDTLSGEHFPHLIHMRENIMALRKKAEVNVLTADKANALYLGFQSSRFYQRLSHRNMHIVRKICPNCKEASDAPLTIKKIVERWTGSVPKFYRGIGCRKCRNTGYLGRIAIHELFIPDDEVLDMITQNATLKELRQIAVQKGMVPLHLDGMEKVVAGITTVDEIVRATNFSE